MNLQSKGLRLISWLDPIIGKLAVLVVFALSIHVTFNSGDLYKSLIDRMS